MKLWNIGIKVVNIFMFIILNFFRDKILFCLKWNNGYNRIRVSVCELYKLSYDIWWLIFIIIG